LQVLIECLELEKVELLEEISTLKAELRRQGKDIKALHLELKEVLNSYREDRSMLRYAQITFDLQKVAASYFQLPSDFSLNEMKEHLIDADQRAKRNQFLQEFGLSPTLVTTANGLKSSRIKLAHIPITEEMVKAMENDVYTTFEETDLQQRVLALILISI